MGKKTIVTHEGKFHADDVFAVATLLLALQDEAEVRRTRDEEDVASADIAVDVGGIYDAEKNRFDHHQKEGAGVRENSIPYAAFGLVWKKFGEALSGNREAAGRIDRVLVSPLDASDNGVTLAEAVTSLPAEYTLSDMVDVFMPTFEEDVSEIDTAFMEAVLIAKRVILREIARSEAIISSRKEVERAYEEAPDKRLIVFQKDYSWKETLPQFSEPLYVVHPTNRGVWFLMCVRDNPNTFINRKDLPKEWAGLRDAELAAVTGITDAIFCHRNRFMAVARSKDGAIALARLALRANTNNQETSSKQ